MFPFHPLFKKTGPRLKGWGDDEESSLAAAEGAGAEGGAGAGASVALLTLTVSHRKTMGKP